MEVSRARKSAMAHHQQFQLGIRKQKATLSPKSKSTLPNFKFCKSNKSILDNLNPLAPNTVSLKDFLSDEKIDKSELCGLEKYERDTPVMFANETVRSKSYRKRLHGQDCKDCEGFYGDILNSLIKMTSFLWNIYSL